MQPSVSTVIKLDIGRDREIGMTEQTQGGFASDPAAAFAAGGTGGCCGNPPQATMTLPEPVDTGASPCCGTATEAKASNSCCGAAAKADAVASGVGCCG
jgi:hypothetical protein